MDLTLSEEHRLLAESARNFVERDCPTDLVRRLAADPDGFDPALWRSMAALGWTGITIPGTAGGQGGGARELAVLGEALGRGPVPSPLLASTILAAGPIARAGSADQRDRWVPALAAGTAVGTLAVVEAGARDPWGTATMAGGETVSGTKILVPWARTADVVVVATRDGLFLVEPRRGHCTIQRHDDLGADPLFALELVDAPAERLGSGGPDAHAAVLRRTLDLAGVVQFAFAVGAAERALELSVQHARDRHQFDRPIGSFQAVAHRCVDMRTDLDACRYLAYQAAWAVDRGGSADLEIATALAYGKDALRRIFVHAHQVHGAIGFSTEHDLHLFTRYAKAFELAYGSTPHHLERVAVAMGLG